MWFWIILLIIISIYNTVYGFLPESISNKLWVKAIGIVAAGVLLVAGIVQVISSYLDYSYAVVSKDGKILKSKNFKYKINKSIGKDGEFIFIIEERYGDATDVKITPKNPVRYERYNAMDGVGVKFYCKAAELPDFKVEIKK